MLSIAQITDWPVGEFEALVHESELEGFRFMTRLRDEWCAGVNRFSNEGEAFFGVIEDGQLLAVGGINREAEDCGRLRRFYVKKDARRKGVGHVLARHILQFSAGHYSSVVLRTDTEAADRFYIALGFIHFPTCSGATHRIELKRDAHHALEPPMQIKL